MRRGQLKITQAKFYRVSGDSTQHQGVIPDILFPSLFDKDKIGESALDEALPWDTIRAAKYDYDEQIHNSLNKLRKQHEGRSVDDPDFVFLREQKKLIEELRKQTRISLNEKTRKEEQNQNDDKRLALENERRKAKGLDLLDSLEEDDAANDETPAAQTPDGINDGETPEPEIADNSKQPESAANDEGDEQTEEEEEDALLVESGRILLDYVKMEKQSVAQRQAR